MGSQLSTVDSCLPQRERERGHLKLGTTLHAPKHNKRFALSLSFSFSCKCEVTCEICVLELFRAAAAVFYGEAYMLCLEPTVSIKLPACSLAGQNAIKAKHS